MPPSPAVEAFRFKKAEAILVITDGKTEAKSLWDLRAVT
jgi:hypothetical protein